MWMPFPDLKGQAPLRLVRHVRGAGRHTPFPDLKGQAPLRLAHKRRPQHRRYSPFPDLKGQAPLRRHGELPRGSQGASFPDLKGQAPLRPVDSSAEGEKLRTLFLTSKVRLHCDGATESIYDLKSAPFS